MAAMRATILMLVVSNLWIPLSLAATVKPRAAIAGGVELRVLPIGDSITFGAGSTNYNGYRKPLYNSLLALGNEVHFVGNQSEGDFAEPDHEGYRAFRISQIANSGLKGIYAAPNIALVHAGTNDMKDDDDITNAPARLKKLIDLIFSRNAHAAVFVCQLIPADPARYANTVSRSVAFNAAIPDLVASYVSAGKKVAMVSMNKALTVSDLADGLHPSDAGYNKMANAWYDAIIAADKKGWITKPGTATKPPAGTGTSPSQCKSTPSWYDVGKIADGAKAAYSDGDFKPAWYEKRVIAEGACPRAQLHFMDLNGDGLKDYACVDPKTGSVKVHLNIPDSDGKSSGNWNPLGTVVSPTTARNGTWVMFGDLNGDGRDDYIYIDPKTGDVSGWINQLENNGLWQWQSIGKIAGGVGARYDNLQMVDLDGDGRDDFCIVDKNGQVTGWLNTGAASVPDYYKLGVIATGASASSGDMVRLGDATGEGRADYLVIGAGGKVNVMINRLQETSMIPRWLSAVTLAEGPDGVKQDQVRLVDMTGDGKVDYLQIEEKTGKVTLWENKGSGGKYQPGEGVFLCDLDGDGTSDYLWLDHQGKGWGYLNQGKGTNSWYGLGNIIAGTGHSRDQIRMGVLTKSGRADYIVIDDATGRAEWWQNLGKENNYGWASRGVAAAGPKGTIESTYGWKFKGKNVRFADLDGDGLDDYLYINDQGAVVYWKNLGTGSATGAPSWGLPHLVADGVGVAAQDVQFADTNGDGLLDYVVVGRVTGMTRSWHNLGFRDDMSIRWNTPLSFADGVGSRGSAIRVTEMTGDKRADYVSIDPDNGRLNLWHNRCWATGGSDGDNPPFVNNPDSPDDPSFVPYTMPRQRVEEWIALGDSYTAGTGCNGNEQRFAGDAVRGKKSYPMQMSVDQAEWDHINGPGHDLPRFSLHAYTGDKSTKLKQYQLNQGAYKDDKNLPRNQPFGKPQLAVMTIGGNDAGLSHILNNCIYQVWTSKSCQETLDDLNEKINNGWLRNEINSALFSVAYAGRTAAGAVPRESFQVFILEYLTFFDDAMSPECNEYSWGYWPWRQPKLTADLRRRLNSLTRRVNAVIKEAAEDLKMMGVIFVDGLNDAYDGHRYCEPGADEKMKTYQTWFWSIYSGVNTPSEGPGDPNNDAQDLHEPAQRLLDWLFPGQDKKVSEMSSDNPPWEWEGAEKYPDIDALLAAIQDDVDAQGAPFDLLRTFHPKGTAYRQHALQLFDIISRNRIIGTAQPVDPENPGTVGGDNPGTGDGGGGAGTE